MTSMNPVSFGHAVPTPAPRFQGNAAPTENTPHAAQNTRQTNILDAMDALANGNRVQASPAVRFGGVFMPGEDKVYSVEPYQDFALTPHLASNVRQGLQLRSMLKRQAQDDSTLKFYLNLLGSAVYPKQDQAALADSMVLQGHKTDVIIKTHCQVDGLLTMQSATGKRFMYPSASMSLGPLPMILGGDKDHVLRIRDELAQEYVFDLQTKLVERAGIATREEAYKLLDSVKLYNPLEALYTGSKGLIDGVLVPGQRVITRENLDAFLKGKKWNEAQIADFLHDGANVYKVPSSPLAEVSPESVPNLSEEADAKMPKAYMSLKEQMEDASQKAKEAAEKSAEEAKEEQAILLLNMGPFEMRVSLEQELDLEQLKKSIQQIAQKGRLKLSEEELQKVLDTAQQERKNYLKDKAEAEVAARKAKEQITFYQLTNQGTLAITQELPLRHQPLPISLPGHFFIEIPGKLRNSILDDDIIQFNDGFNANTDEQIEKALFELASKKQREDNPSHIKIVINSPGGSVWSAQKLRDTIKLLEEENDKVKVDVIVTGMAASAGSWLLSSATGNRMVLPNGRTMIHQAGGHIIEEGPSNGRERMETMRNYTREYAGVVAEATGRTRQAVEKDFEKDVWVNSVEALFYGSKGLADGILVGPDQVITRQDVYDYLVENADTLDLGGGKVKGWADKTPEQKVKHFIDARLRSYRQARNSKDFSADNPFDNVLKTIDEVARRSARKMAEDDQFRRSMPNPDSTSMDIFTVTPISVVEKLLTGGEGELSAKAPGFDPAALKILESNIL